MLITLFALIKLSWLAAVSLEQEEAIVWQNYHPELHAELLGVQALLHEMIEARLPRHGIFLQTGYRFSDLTIYRTGDTPATHRACAWLEQKNSRKPVNLIIKEVSWPLNRTKPEILNSYTYELYEGAIAPSVHDMSLQQQIDFTRQLIQIVGLIPIASALGTSTDPLPITV